MSTPVLRAIIIEDSRLIVDDTADYTLDCEYIMINKGTFIVGSDEHPHLHKFHMTFHGRKEAR